MANHNLPTLTSTYANFVTEMDARMDDISIGFDPALTTVTNQAINTIRWVAASNKWQKWSGSTWNDLSSGYAISITGSAASVSSSLTVNNSGTGVASGTTFNGSTAVTISYNTVGAPSTTGTNATGDWDINVTGNAATATKLNTGANAWLAEQSGTDLIFKYNGTTVFKITSAGALLSAGDMTASTTF